MLRWHHCVRQGVSGNLTDKSTTSTKYDTEREGSLPSHTMFKVVSDKLPPMPALSCQDSCQCQHKRELANLLEVRGKDAFIPAAPSGVGGLAAMA